MGTLTPAEVEADAGRQAPARRRWRRVGLAALGLGSVVLLAAIGVGLWGWSRHAAHVDRIEALVAASAARGEPTTVEALLAAIPTESRSTSFAAFVAELEAVGDRVLPIADALVEVSGWRAPDRPSAAQALLGDLQGRGSDERASDGRASEGHGAEGRDAVGLEQLSGLVERAAEAVEPGSEDHPGSQLDAQLLEARRAGQVPDADGPLHAWVQLLLADGADTLDLLERLPSVGDRDRLAELMNHGGPTATLQLQSPVVLLVAVDVLEVELMRALIEDGPPAVDTLDRVLALHAALDARLGPPASLFDFHLSMALLGRRLELLRYGSTALAGHPELAALLAEERAELAALDLAGRFRSALIGERLWLDGAYDAVTRSEDLEGLAANRVLEWLAPIFLGEGRARLYAASVDLVERVDRAGLDLWGADGVGGFAMPDPPRWDLVGRLVYRDFGRDVQSAVGAERARRFVLCALTGRLEGTEALEAARARWSDPLVGEPFRVGLDERRRRVLEAADVARYPLASWRLE